MFVMPLRYTQVQQSFCRVEHLSSEDIFMNPSEIERLLASYLAMLTVEEGATVLGIHCRSVQCWIHQSRFTTIRAGHTYRIR